MERSNVNIDMRTIVKELEDKVSTLVKNNQELTASIKDVKKDLMLMEKKKKGKMSLFIILAKNRPDSNQFIQS